jgi:hypothetical protein
MILTGLALVISLLAGIPESASADDTAPPPSGTTFRLPETGGVWTRDANPAGRELAWEEARRFLADLNGKGFGGCAQWILPSRDDLTAMARYMGNGGSDESGIYPVADFYWSSTTGSLESGYADAVSMEDGSVDSQSKDELNYLWPLCAVK